MWPPPPPWPPPPWPPPPGAPRLLPGCRSQQPSRAPPARWTTRGDPAAAARRLRGGREARGSAGTGRRGGMDGGKSTGWGWGRKKRRKTTRPGGFARWFCSRATRLRGARTWTARGARGDGDGGVAGGNLAGRDWTGIGAEGSARASAHRGAPAQAGHGRGSAGGRRARQFARRVVAQLSWGDSATSACWPDEKAAVQARADVPQARLRQAGRPAARAGVRRASCQAGRVSAIDRSVWWRVCGRSVAGLRSVWRLCRLCPAHRRSSAVVHSRRRAISDPLMHCSRCT
eukprot:SAG31_NODE_2988_length_4814_cov_11.404030_4_plen_287_part_00